MLTKLGRMNLWTGKRMQLNLVMEKVIGTQILDFFLCGVIFVHSHAPPLLQHCRICGICHLHRQSVI